MDISWLGNSAIRIQSGLTTVVSDPFYADGSTTMPTTTAQIVTISLDDPRHSNANGVKGDPRVLHGPGEYEIANFYISGMGTPYTPSSPNDAPHDEAAQRQINTVFTMRAEGMRVCHAGALVPTLTPRQLDELNNIEVLVVDAGGDSARRVARLVSQIGPRIVVPVGWQAAADDRDDISALQPLLGELGITDAPKQSTLRVTPTSLPRELSVVPLRRTT